MFSTQPNAATTLLLVAVAALVAAPASEAQQGETRPAESAAAAKPNPALLDPSLATATAPATYRVRLETTKGEVVIKVVRDWAPHGADRFYNLVTIGYYDHTAFFRVLDGFVAQVGISGDPRVAAAWDEATIPDDEIRQPNTRAMVTFAMSSAPSSRTTQIFFNYADNSRLSEYGKFAPFGRVVEGMEVIDSLYSGYGEGAPRGQGPSQERITREGNEYLERDFPRLDYIVRAVVLDQ